MTDLGALAARAMAHARWADTPDRSAATKPARDRFEQRFLDAVDPDRVLPEAERLKRAESARSAYFAGLALKSAQARKRKAPVKAEAESPEQQQRTLTPTSSVHPTAPNGRKEHGEHTRT